MPTKKPFFSVLIPTYDRAKLLPLAIESVLAQSFTDLELIISTGGSTDETVDVVKNFKDSRIKRLDSDVRLKIGDNYQAVLNGASGEYLIFLSDDDALAPTTLEKMRQLIAEDETRKVIAFRYATYIPKSESNPTGNILKAHNFTGELHSFSREESLHALFRHHGLAAGKMDANFIIPYLANAVYHHSVFAHVQEKKPGPFSGTPVDLYLAAAIFGVIENYYCLDLPLHVWSSWENNSSVYLNPAVELRKHYEKLLGGKTLEYTPLKFALPLNCSINEILRASRDFASEFGAVKFDEERYFIAMAEYLTYLRAEGVDTAGEMAEYKMALAARPEEFRRQVKAATANSYFRIRQNLKMFAPAVARSLKFVRDHARRMGGKAPENIVIDGAGKFNNVREAAEYLSANVIS